MRWPPPLTSLCAHRRSLPTRRTSTGAWRTRWHPSCLVTACAACTAGSVLRCWVSLTWPSSFLSTSSSSPASCTLVRPLMRTQTPTHPPTHRLTRTHTHIHPHAHTCTRAPHTHTYCSSLSVGLCRGVCSLSSLMVWACGAEHQHGRRPDAPLSWPSIIAASAVSKVCASVCTYPHEVRASAYDRRKAID
jgi:hypothetical protein